MIQQEKKRQIYIVVSQTGTLLSRILKFITGAKYNHVSISMTKDLGKMYSFGRKMAYNPFWGGFVLESREHGTFKRFSNTEAVILEIPVEEELYDKMQCYLDKMYQEKNTYHYNYLGLFLAALHIRYCQKNSYYCSEFVQEILLRFKIMQARQCQEIVQPIHFLNLFEKQAVYSGKLQNCYLE